MDNTRGVPTPNPNNSTKPRVRGDIPGLKWVDDSAFIDYSRHFDAAYDKAHAEADAKAISDIYALGGIMTYSVAAKQKCEEQGIPINRHNLRKMEAKLRHARKRR